MPAYLIADIEITDPDGYAEYRKGVPATIEAHGGRFLARGGATQPLEGDWAPARLVIIEFPSLARLKTWYESPEYRPLLELRRRSSKGNLLAVEGAGPPALARP